MENVDLFLRFGAVLAIGFKNRKLTLYLLLGHGITRTLQV